MLVDKVIIADAAGAEAALAGLLVAAVIVLPALGYLLWLTQTEEWTRARTALGRRQRCVTGRRAQHLRALSFQTRPEPLSSAANSSSCHASHHKPSTR